MKNFGYDFHHNVLAERGSFETALSAAKKHTLKELLQKPVEGFINQKLKTPLCDRIFNGIAYEQYIFYYPEK